MNRAKKHCTMILLAAGRGSRMKSDRPKQFLTVGGKPLLWYALETIEKSSVIDACILVTGEEDVDFVKKEIVSRYGFAKVSLVVAGGRERYDSVWNGICAVKNQDGILFVHDGARPFLTEKILQDTYEAALTNGAAVAAVPAKDTIKIADEAGFVQMTPQRNLVWNVQTPQVFEAALLKSSYEKFFAAKEQEPEQCVSITDDAGVVEAFGEKKVKLVPAAYTNIKITTPEDMAVAESFLQKEGSWAE